MILNSMRGRLVIWLAFLLVGILLGFGVTVFGLQRQNRMAQIDNDLQHRLAAFSADARERIPPPTIIPLREPPEAHDPDFVTKLDQSTNAIDLSTNSTDLTTNSVDLATNATVLNVLPPPPPNPRTRRIVLTAPTARLFNEADTNDFYFSFWSRDGDVLRRSTNAPATVSLPKRPGQSTLIHFRTHDFLREAFNYTDVGECALVGHSLVGETTALQDFAWRLVFIGVAVLIVGLGGVWMLVHRAIQPVEKISTTSRRIADGHLSERIKGREDHSELGQLIGVLNGTFARLEAAFTQQKQFTADASHELRTPIAVLISEAQTTLARERSSDEYRETIEACLDTAQQMRHLTDSLLELARFDAGQEKMPYTRFNLAEKVQAAIELVRPLANEKKLEFLVHLRDMQFTGSASRISQVIVNLLNNAIRYNVEEGKIGVTIHPPEEDAIELTISDTGCGIDPEELPRVFERFYRADKARSGETGGFGLGLAISKAIVEAHNGEIMVSSKPGIGSLFLVRLPIRAGTWAVGRDPVEP